MTHNALVRKGHEVAPGVRRMPLARVEYMLGLDVTESPESDAMVDAPAVLEPHLVRIFCFYTFPS